MLPQLSQIGLPQNIKGALKYIASEKTRKQQERVTNLQIKALERQESYAAEDRQSELDKRNFDKLIMKSQIDRLPLEQQIKEFEFMAKGSEAFSEQLKNANEANWPTIRQMGAKVGIKTPERYDPAWVKNAQQRALSAKELASLKGEEKKNELLKIKLSEAEKNRKENEKNREEAEKRRKHAANMREAEIELQKTREKGTKTKEDEYKKNQIMDDWRSDYNKRLDLLKNDPNYFELGAYGAAVVKPEKYKEYKAKEDALRTEYEAGQRMILQGQIPPRMAGMKAGQDSKSQYVGEFIKGLTTGY